MPTDNTQRKHSGLIPFKPGQSGNPDGRPKGARNKFSEDFVVALYTDFKEHGPAAIAKVRETKPEQYLKVIAQVIPREIHHSADGYDDLESLDEAELGERLRQVYDRIGAALLDKGKAGRC